MHKAILQMQWDCCIELVGVYLYLLHCLPLQKGSLLLISGNEAMSKPLIKGSALLLEDTLENLIIELAWQVSR